MAASLLQECLHTLQSSVKGDISQKEQSVLVVSDLHQICIYESTSKDIDLICSSLFDKDYGLLVFLSKAVTIDELQACKAKCLDLLQEFMISDKVGKKILPYAVDIKDVCVSLFSRDRYAKVKNAAVPVLCRLLELTVGSPMGKELQIDKLIQKFFNELTKPSSKIPATVREKVYMLLGVLSEVYPEYMTPYSERLTGIYLRGLSTEMNSKTRKPEMPIISGCLEGLCCLLVNFTAEEGSKNSYEVYSYARKAIDNSAELTRYDVPKAGLRLFGRHASQFSQYIIEDYENLYTKLSYWSRHKNSELLLLGTIALESFLNQVAEMLKEKAKEGKKEGASIFKYFVCSFREIMNRDDASSKELSLAIKGYGLLAGPCRCYMKPEDVQFMFVEILIKTERQFLGQVEGLEDKLYNLPSYIESLASIVREMSDLSESYATSLEHLMVLLVENIPNIHTKKHYQCHRAILWLLLSIMPKGTTFRHVLSGFVYQCLIRTCSYAPISETENEGETAPAESQGVRVITYKDFMGTWMGLLDATVIKEFAAADISLETRSQLTDALYNEIIVAVLKILDKLDLTSSPTEKQDESDSASTSMEEDLGLSSADPLLGVQAKRPKDFQVFISLTDFCKDLLTVKHVGKFECWVFPFTHKLIYFSTDNPLASGFYKLLSVSMKIANRINYFKGLNETSLPYVAIKEEEDSCMDEIVSVGQSQRLTCFSLIKKFSKEVLVRMKQYRDELLASCLTFILALPKEVVSEQMMEIVPAIEVTLRIGLSYLPLAMIAMDALEFWSRSLPSHILAPYYPRILPYLDSFLKTGDQGADDVNVESNINVTKNKSGKGRQKLSIRLIKAKRDTISQSYQSQLSCVKQRILQYLGRLGGSINCELLANTDLEISKQAISWDNEKHLKFDMPFVDMKPTIYLDPFLPRVVELATSSSDRQTKVAACELLHSLILYSIGRGAQQPGQRVQRTSMEGLYKHIFPTMLKLACDVELVAKQLFEPLTMQIIHWLTSSKRPENNETMTLLDAIYDGMIQQTDTSLRDFSAHCLHEFLKWSIKQTSVKASETNPANAKSVLKRLFSYALHPSPFKRLGAALAFNNIYTVFREEEALVNLFTFKLLVTLVESLALAHADEKSLGTQEQCCKSLEHLEKIIRYKAAILKVPNKLRTEPRHWSSITLDIAVRWLTKQCGRPQTECRHACMKLSYQLSALLKGIKTPAMFFQTCLKGKGPDYWIERFEGGGTNQAGIAGYPTLTDDTDTFSLQSTLTWFDNILAALDCYTWVFGENLLSPGDLFKEGKTNIFISVEYFLKKVALVNIESVASLFPQKLNYDFFTPKEKDDFNRAKCTVIVRLFSFLSVMLAKYRKETVAVVPKTLWRGELWELVCSCVVEPMSVGFNMGDVEIIKNLPQEMGQTLAVLSTVFKDDMIKHFNKSLAGDRNLFDKLPLPLNDNAIDYVSTQQMINGYIQLHEVNLLLPCQPGGKSGPCSQRLFESVFKSIATDSSGTLTLVTLSPTSLATAKAMLKLAFALDLPVRTLMDALQCNTKVVGGSSRTSVQAYGDLLFSLFRSAISQYSLGKVEELLPLLVKNAKSEPRRVSTILTGVVDFLSRDRELRKKQGEKILDAILAQWSNLSVWWGQDSSQDTQGMALLLLTKLLLIDSKFTSTVHHPAFEQVFSMYQTMLTDTRTPLSFKCQVLDLLPFFAVVPDPYTAKMKSSLDKLVADSFPIRSSELVKGSQKYYDYISALDKILGGFQLCSSLMLLEYLISIFCREPEHVHEEAIQTAIAKFTRRLPRDKQKEALDVPFRIFTNKARYPAEIRRATIERVCLPMLQLVTKSAFIEFYTDHIVEMRELIEERLSRSNEGMLEGQLTSRLCCFEILEVLYTRLTKDELVGTNSNINRVFARGNVQNGKELTSFVSKQANDAKSEDVRDEQSLLELRRQYHCAAYNLMVAFISRTQTELKFYTAFLFEEKETKGQFLMDNLIDKEKMYEFPVEFMSPIERKKKFVTIHQEVKERKRDATADDDDDTFEDATPSLHLATQYLADSSLSEDVSQYFSMSSAAGSLTSQGRRQNNKARSESRESKDTDERGDDEFVELEMDMLNKHECMATMIAVIKHMQKQKITPEVPPGTVAPPLPTWMEKLHTKMCHSRTDFNIKLFIAKLIVNTAEVFQPYASHWLRPLCQLIISGPLGSGSINYFIVDLIVTMLSWHQTAIPQDTVEEKAMASRLVHFVMKNIYHENRQIFKNNLEMLKTLLECWKDRVEIPYQEVYELLKLEEGRGTTVGIQVLGVVMSCKFPPYGPVAPVDRDRYFARVASHMKIQLKTTHAPAAEVVGMIFRFLAEKEDTKEGTFHNYVGDLMMSLHQAKPDIFITCVHKMQKHYPPIGERFVNKLLFMLPKLHGEFTTMCLEVLHGQIDSIDNVYTELKTKGIHKTISHRDEGTQLISLKIVKAILVKLKPAELGSLMPLISAFSTNPSSSCRNIMYDILMWIYDNYREEESTECHEIMQRTKESLLKGLGDEDLHCRLQVQNFWSSETRLPVGTLDRLVDMLGAMYSPVTEQHFLSYATNLLLEMTSKSPDYQREIFEHPLSECKFSDYAVKSSWRQRHAAMTPLFATMASQSQMEINEDSVDGVRATQDVQQFTQTLEPGAHKGPFNWLTQSSLDTYSDMASISMETQTTQSSLLFTLGTDDPRSRVARRPKPGPHFGKQRLTAPKQSTSDKKIDEKGQGNELLRLKRRFFKDQEQTRMSFAKHQTRLKELREKKLQEQKIRRENQVTMYRKYRSGDLPDIQIKYSYLIAPLQALAHRDSGIAKLLFSHVFQAIFNCMEMVKTEREMGETIVQIKSSLNSVLSESTQYYSPFIGCILDILYKLRTQLVVNVASAGSSSVFSKLQPLGIVVLEEQLIVHDPADERAAKRGRSTSPVSKDTTHWIELSRLYKSIEEFDVLLGIFSSKVGTQSITQEALEAEARGDYSTARKLYNQALKQDLANSGVQTSEIDLWEECRMECLTNLCQWDQLESVTVSAIDDGDNVDLRQVWDDTYLQEHFLPFLLRSKVKLMLQGDENQQSLLSFIDDSMKTPQHKIILENHYSEELSLMYLWQEDYDRARHYANMATESFLQDWSSMDTLMLASRTAALQKLQPLIELQEFLNFMADERNLMSHDPAERLVRSWNQRTPHLLTDPVTIWDNVVTNRCVYLDHISGKLSSVDESQHSMEVDSSDIFQDTKLRLKLRMAESCTEQNNFTLTLRILKETHSACKRSDTASLLCEWTHLYARTHQRKIQNTMDNWTDDTLNSVITTLDQLGKIKGSEALSKYSALGRRHHVLSGQSYELLGLGLQSMDLQTLEGTKLADKLLEYADIRKLNKQELLEQLLRQGYKDMKASLSVEAQGPHKEQFGQEQAYLSTALYCDKILRRQEDDELDIGAGCTKQFPETIVVCLLKAMKLDSMEARQRFPRLLQIAEMYPDTMATFISKSCEVPCWMFLLWISQMLAILDKPESPVVHKILENITTTYPQAVVYPLKLSVEGYKFSNSKQDKVNAAMVERLKSLVGPEKIPLTEKFVSALECFGQPDQEFKDAFDDMVKYFKKGQKARAAEKYRQIYWRVLDYKNREEKEGKLGKSKSQSSQRGKGSGDTSADMEPSLLPSESILDIGSYARKFADKFKKDFDKKFGEDGRKLTSMSFKDFHIARIQLKDMFETEMRSSLKPPAKLIEYSKWLSDFNPNIHGRSLELPGQYTGLSKPLPEYHVKVAGFDQRVIVLSSLRKPKRITIRGNDERDYHFLVKGGEDLRQDQRIEQLFYIMNQVFNRDPACRNRKLQLKTYQVIPMTTRVGLIEWVGNTQTLKDFLHMSLSDQERKIFEHSNKQGPHYAHTNWINQACSKSDKNWPMKFISMFDKYSCTETERQINITQSKVPWDMFRRSFQQLSSSPEAFHVLQHKCMKSHAMLCICQYILGIGDRHLSNFMVNMKTGEMVGIDFGHAFGSATQFLPIPELVPFRLTRQIRNLMLPLQEKGLLENTMIHVLRALRSDSDLLMNTLDIFVKEPSLDWLQNAETQKQSMSEDDIEAMSIEGDDDIKWYPREKIQVVKKKLNGANPAYITRDELKLGHGKNPGAFRNYERVALGQKTSVRAKLPEKGLSVEKQVEALIDQATDPNILGRTWIGWDPWV